MFRFNKLFPVAAAMFALLALVGVSGCGQESPAGSQQPSSSDAEDALVTDESIQAAQEAVQQVQDRAAEQAAEVQEAVEQSAADAQTQVDEAVEEAQAQSQQMMEDASEQANKAADEAAKAIQTP